MKRMVGTSGSMSSTLGCAPSLSEAQFGSAGDGGHGRSRGFLGAAALLAGGEQAGNGGQSKE